MSAVTVKELIEKLKKLPQHWEVKIDLEHPSPVSQIKPYTGSGIYNVAEVYVMDEGEVGLEID